MAGKRGAGDGRLWVDGDADMYAEIEQWFDTAIDASFLTDVFK